MKRCNLCGDQKPIDAFSKDPSSSDGKNRRCRICAARKTRESYRARGGYTETIKNRQNAKRESNRQKMVEYLSDHPCVKCGENDPIVLDFDHISPGNKRIQVSTLMRSCVKWETILREINKCEVRCANCHRRRTAMQFGWWQTRIPALQALK